MIAPLLPLVRGHVVVEHVRWGYCASISFVGVPARPLKMRTRGHSRRNSQTCAFAPLLLEFDKASVRNTVFDGHGPLKLGTHCRRGSEDVILREHALYRAFNLVTTRSFRSRVAQMKYVEAGSGRVIGEEPGHFIEDNDDVAKRMEHGSRPAASAGSV